MFFQNPIIPGFNPDPSICRVGDEFFLCTSTFAYWPGLPIYHSKDLLDWKLLGHVLTRPSQLTMRNNMAHVGGICAPVIRYHKGWFYVSVAAMDSREGITSFEGARGFIVKTNNIFDETKWSEPVAIDVLGIDQDLFFDDDGKTYMSLAVILPDHSPHKRMPFSMGTYVYQIDLDTGSCLTKPKLIRTSETVIGIAEGPHIYKKDGYYYLSTAEGGTETEHQQWISRSKEGPFGPWEEGPVGAVNPMIYNADHPDIRNTGHADFVEDAQGNWWIVFLAVRPPNNGIYHISQLGRETFMCPVEWVDGWPIVNSRKRVELDCPSGGREMKKFFAPTNWVDQFEMTGTGDLATGWYQLRTPVKKSYSLTERPNWLTIHGSAYHITSEEAASMVLQKQVRFSVDWSTKLEFYPTEVNHEAGAVIWLSKHAFASIGIRLGADGQREIVGKYHQNIEKPTNGTNGYHSNKTGRDLMLLEIYAKEGPKETIIKEVVEPLSSSSGPVGLIIKARPTFYELHYQLEFQKSVKMAEFKSSMLLQRLPCFTGAFFGLYAFGGENMPCLDPAYFEFANWEEK